MTSAGDLELAFYERFLFARGIEPFAAQERAFSAIFAGQSVLVTVPTGTGKTLMAKAALFRARALGQRAVYTTPLRALTEEKFRELCEDFGEEEVGFATGDYRVRPEAPIQVLVAEILWNRIYGERATDVADVVVMDEGHYFNDPERGYVWEQSIIGLDPRVQLVILSATVGDPEQFCQWAYLCRRAEMALVTSDERRVPLYHRYGEVYLVELAKELLAQGEVPAIVFSFSRNECFERARLLKSCPRFTSEEERVRIAELCEGVIEERGLGPDLRGLLLHGIGVHHAGILPRYKQLVERLTLERLLKIVVSTETIAAGINLPAKRVVFPSLRKFVQGQARLLSSAEYHQMAGRAGRPQFDAEGIAITLAPEEVVQEIRKEIKARKAQGNEIESERVRRGVYARARAEAVKAGDVTWDRAAFDKLVAGKPASLKSQTRITAEQILAIGLPDLAEKPIVETVAEKPAELPACFDLNVATVINNLLLGPKERAAAQKALAQATANLRALEVVDEHGRQVQGELIGKLRGVDGVYVWYALKSRDLDYAGLRELCEYLVDHDVIPRLLGKKDEEKKREWIKTRLRERRRDEPQVSWEDVEAEYLAAFPRPLTPPELIHAELVALLPHPELHPGGRPKRVFAAMEEEGLGFWDFVDQHGLEAEEGNLFSYLSRLLKLARMIHEHTGIGELDTLVQGVRALLVPIDSRVEESRG